MSWAKLSAGAWLFHFATNFIPGPSADFWGQVDVWIPPETFTACGDGALEGTTADFIDFGNDSIHARLFGGVWKWETNYGNVAATGPTPGSTHTIKFHYISGTAFGSGHVDWYVDGVLVVSDSGVNNFVQSSLFINHFPEGCCCEIYYYTNVRVGHSEGGTDIFGDDFSGGLGNWTRNQVMPSAFGLIAAPVAAACPTLTVSPARGLPGTTFTVTATGLAPNRPLTMFFDNHPITISESSDGSGNATFTVTVPHLPDSGVFEGYGVFLLDDVGNIACSDSFAPGGGFGICGTEPADGISTAVDPVVTATGGITNNGNRILDYIFHDGAHWVLWQDVSVTTGLTTFPPPANHTMNATRISADGASVVDYPIDTNYCWHFGSGNVGDPGLFSSRQCGVTSVSAPVWDSTFYFASWSKPILDARFASDGTSLWVAVLTQETVVYPWLDNKDAVAPNPGSAAQFVPLSTLTSGFTSFATNVGTGYHRFNTQTDGAINTYKDHAYPVTDAGEKDSGHWSPPVVVMFAFDGSGFNRIGQIDAKYAPGITGGQGYGNAGILGVPLLLQDGQRGTLYSRVSMCASPNEPGVCHVVWSEGGDWGRQGDGDPCGVGKFVWDAGPANRSYRVNYTRWTATAKVFDNDIFSSHVDRSSWFFLNDYGQGGADFPVGYTWPDQGNFAGLLAHDLRNDNAEGRVYLFAAIPQCIQNAMIPIAENSCNFAPPPAYIDPHGHPFLDYSILYSDTLHVYDLSGGNAVLLQSLDLSTLAPDNGEIESFWAPNPPYADPLGPADCLYSPVNAIFDPRQASYTVLDKGFGLSLPYDDPDLGVPVYLVHTSLVKRWLPESASPLETLSNGYGPVRAFYRIPCDMSAGFDYLDGDRQLGFTIVKEPYGDPFSGFTSFFYNSDFFSDPKNLWVPAPSDPTSFGFGSNGYIGESFDRVCTNRWVPLTNSPPLTPPASNYWLGSQCPGFHYDPDSDSITTVAGPSAFPPAGGPLFAITTLYLCRGCRGCKCATGVHLAHRF